MSLGQTSDNPICQAQWVGASLLSIGARSKNLWTNEHIARPPDLFEPTYTHTADLSKHSSLSGITLCSLLILSSCRASTGGQSDWYQDVIQLRCRRRIGGRGSPRLCRSISVIELTVDVPVRSSMGTIWWRWYILRLNSF